MCPVSEAVLAVGVDGVAKHWLLSSRSEMKEMEGSIAEETSQTLNLSTPPLSLSSYSYQKTHCIVLLVCKEAWQVGRVGLFRSCCYGDVCEGQVYDATGGKMKLLMIRPCEPSVLGGWMKGDFLDNLMLVAWSMEDGRAFIYKLSAK